jgi:hypothetical protein
LLQYGKEVPWAYPKLPLCKQVSSAAQRSVKNCKFGGLFFDRGAAVPK